MTEREIEVREKEITKLRGADALKNAIKKTEEDLIRAQDLVDYNIEEISKFEKELERAENEKTSKSKSINSIRDESDTKEYALKRKRAGKESWEQEVKELTDLLKRLREEEGCGDSNKRGKKTKV